MNFYWILFTGILLINHCDGFFHPERFQEFIDKYVDIEKFKEEGLRSLNSTAWDYIWNYFKTKFRRHYPTTEEEEERVRIFREHMKFVLNSNINGKHTYRLALNQFSDWTLEEIDLYSRGLKHPKHLRSIEFNYENNQQRIQRSLDKLHQNYHHFSTSKRDRQEFIIPDWIWDFFFNNNDDNNENPDNDKDDNSDQSTNFDWRTKNIVSPIKNQDKCGSCYSFATIQVLESVYAIKHGSKNVTKFSPQQIVDCSSSYGNGGCNGGNIEPSLQYLKEQNGKIATEASYPYTAKDGTCQTNAETVDLGNIEYTRIEAGNEKKLAEALLEYGPLYTCFYASTEAFSFYEAGVLSIPNCPNQYTNHAVLLVGFGYDKILKKHYWLIKNSYGTEWGENGYLRIEKDHGNMCGIASEATYVQLK